MNRSGLLERVMIAMYRMDWRERILMRHLFKMLKRKIMNQCHDNKNEKEKKGRRGGMEIELMALGDHLDVEGEEKDRSKDERKMPNIVDMGDIGEKSFEGRIRVDYILFKPSEFERYSTANSKYRFEMQRGKIKKS